jgi:nucleotidyltransferase substrate binding protein (TIGR01987 family)
MYLQLDPFEKAFSSLIIGLNRAEQNQGDFEIRDGCIQRFEYTYELAIKFIKRYIQGNYPIPVNIEQMNFRDLLRVAAEIGLVKQVEGWFQFREARNKTSHTYDEAKAKEVFEIIASFVDESRYLLDQLKRRISET